jgi:hypothetical protein
MKTNSSLIKIALLSIITCGFVTAHSVWAQAFPDILGQYQGFAQSSAFPTDQHGPAEVTINFAQPAPDSLRFQGRLTIFGRTYDISGNLLTDGTFNFSNGRHGNAALTGAGKWQDLNRGGALALGSYKLGRDEGKLALLRPFADPPSEHAPPYIGGSWGGTVGSTLSITVGTVQWNVQQERSPGGVPSTRFMGQETIDMGTAGRIINDFVGTISDDGGERGIHFVRIANSSRGMLIDGGEVDPPDPDLQPLHAHPVLNFVDGGVDLLSMTLIGLL